jgi:hypothetical protein
MNLFHQINVDDERLVFPYKTAYSVIIRLCSSRLIIKVFQIMYRNHFISWLLLDGTVSV